MTYQEAYQKLEKNDQLHVLKYYDELSDTQKEALLKQVEETDFSVLVKKGHTQKAAKKGAITPLRVMQISESTARAAEFKEIGLQAVREGKVGAVLLAGGMGTRLGSDHPKGMYDIGLTKHVYIFQRIIENIMDVVNESGAWLPVFVMTSEKNHQDTVAFFEEKNFFGYKKEYITFFKQDMAPASDYDGKVYMEEKGRISTSPNGNGGWFVSMYRCGIVKTLQEKGIEWLNVFSVDNVLQRIADPMFTGAVIASGCAVGSKVVKKAAPDEKVGVMCLEDGRPSIIEYYELTDELMQAKDANGDPAYYYGVTLNYLFRRMDLEEILNQNLPLHVVEKKIPCLDENGNQVKPETPNGYKYEQLVLDMIHELKDCLPYEVVREHEFAPIKNKTGIDSVETARELCKKNGIVL